MKYATLLLLMVFSVSAHAQTTPKHQIDKELEACLAKGAEDCFQIAFSRWEGLLNRNLTLLLNVIDDASKKKLRLSQDQWEKFRDLEFDAIDAIYSGSGTMGNQLATSDKLDLYRKRALQLESYRSMIE